MLNHADSAADAATADPLRDDDGAIRGFVLEKGMPGLSAPRIEGKFCRSLEVRGTVYLETATPFHGQGGQIIGTVRVLRLRDDVLHQLPAGREPLPGSLALAEAPCASISS